MADLVSPMTLNDVVEQVNDLTQAPNYRPFNVSWTTNSTILAFLQDVYADATAMPGFVYLGALTCSDLPTGLGNVEAVVEILPSTVSTKVIHIVITSGDQAPYRWELTYWVVGATENSSGWIGYQPEPSYNSLTETLEF